MRKGDSFKNSTDLDYLQTFNGVQIAAGGGLSLFAVFAPDPDICGLHDYFRIACFPVHRHIPPAADRAPRGVPIH